MSSKLQKASKAMVVCGLRIRNEAGQLVDASCEKIMEEDELLAEAESTVSRHKSGGRWKFVLLVFIFGCCTGLGWLLNDCLPGSCWEESEAPSTNFERFNYAAAAPSATSSSTGVMEVFQVYQPAFSPQGATEEAFLTNGLETPLTAAAGASPNSCEVLLMDHTFAFSYGIPFIGNYTPPKCKFDRVTMNFTVTSKGRQFDRLALMYFGDTEVWRTSTAEPTAHGISWTYIKDMTEFMYFWNSPQTLIFDLGNLVDSTYTGLFNTTLKATFFTSQDTVEPASEPASLIIPISARKGASAAPSLFTLPSDNATNTISFPRNVNRAVFSVSACGQATEEFWWSNVLQSDIDTFEALGGTLYGYSPFREVQILIDGQLAGVQWPFPVIFTGGVVPVLWRPIVGIDAFDLREHEIDITPWLPVLCNGAEHTFEIRVAGILDDGKGNGVITETVGSSWYVTGKIFVWLDDDERYITTGRAPTVLLPAPVITLSQSLTQDATGANKSLSYTTNIKRDLSISSHVTSQKGTHLSIWTQSLSVANYGLYADYGTVQQINQTTTGTDQSTGGVYYKASYSYPLYANTSYLIQPSGNFTIDATIIRGHSLAIHGTPVFPTGLRPLTSIPNGASLASGFSGSRLSTTQNGTAHYFGSPSAGTSSGYGSTSQEFSFSGIDARGGVGGDTELYYRNVEAVNSTVVKDCETLAGVDIGSFSLPLAAVPEAQTVMGTVSPREAIGRGPGTAKQVLVQTSGSG